MTRSLQERDEADPGDAPADPARRPGQPGAGDGHGANSPARPAGPRPSGYAEQAVPPRHPSRQPQADAGKAPPEPPPLSDGSTRAGPA
ncbi:MAG: hypothetical protein ACK4M0_12625 [Phreatobacter sp.]